MRRDVHTGCLNVRQNLKKRGNYEARREVGGFAEATYPITDALRVTGGLRYDETQVGVTQTLTLNQTTTTFLDFNTPYAGYPEILTSKSLSGSAGAGERAAPRDSGS